VILSPVIFTQSRNIKKATDLRTLRYGGPGAGRRVGVSTVHTSFLAPYICPMKDRPGPAGPFSEQGAEPLSSLVGASSVLALVRPTSQKVPQATFACTRFS
jgi:hypothetical protein